MRKQAIQVWLSALILLALLTLVSAAWACTGQPQVVALSTDRAPVGTEVTVIGERVPTQFVEIRWDSLQGPVIGRGTATNGDFAILALVPDAPPGIYYMVVAALPLGYPEGTPPSVTRVSFEVTASPALAAEPAGLHNHSSDLWSGFSQAAPELSVGSPAAGNNEVSPAPALGIGVGIFAFGAGALIVSAATAVARKPHPSRRPEGRTR